MRIANYILSFFVLMASCQSPKDQEKFNWNAGISSPKYYSAAPFVEYFYQGKSVAGASTNVGVGQGWGITMGGYTGGDIFKPVPDSVFVKWSCGVDDILYEGGYKLPRKKMIQLFRKGAVNPNNAKIDDYTLLVGGTAPGGNVSIWMKAGQVITEIVKFKAQNKGIWMKGNIEYHKLMKEIKNSKEYINSETSIYLYFHGVPYSIWEKGEKKYDYDMGFTTQELDEKNMGMSITGYSKDGSLVYATRNLQYIPLNGNYIIPQNKLIKKLPVQLFLQWISSDQQQWYQAEIVLPNNFDQQFQTFQKHSGNQTLLIISMEKLNSENTNSTFGKVWLESSNTKKEIMRFRAAKLDTKTRKFLVSEYSIPKGFVFPNWEGRETLKTPEIEYWQEK